MQALRDFLVDFFIFVLALIMSTVVALSSKLKEHVDAKKVCVQKACTKS